MYFRDRRDAGERLSKMLGVYHGRNDVVVLGLPRGGVVVAAEVARVLEAPLDIVVPRKIGAPGNPEFAIGAIAETGERVMNEQALAFGGIPDEYIEREAEKEQKEAQRRLALYRKNRPILDLRHKTVILVDDGIATGLTMQAAVVSIQKRGAEKIVIAVPVAASESLPQLRKMVDAVLCLFTPSDFGSVGSFYQHFEQTTDEEVITLLSSFASLPFSNSRE